MSDPKYTIDTCSINDFLQLDRAYDCEVFVTLWSHIDAGCQSGEIISHQEVFEEIAMGEVSAVVKWARMRKDIFKDYDLPGEANLVTEIGSKFPTFLHQKKDVPIHADPWLVAQAKLHSLTIITSEKANNNSGIPFVAQALDVPTLDIVSFFKSRGIKV